MTERYVDITDTKPFLNGRHKMPMIAVHIQPDNRRVVSKGRMVVEMWGNPLSGHVEPFIVLNMVNGRFPQIDAHFTLLEDWRPYAGVVEETAVPDAEEVESFDGETAVDYAKLDRFMDSSMSAQVVRLTVIWMFVVAALLLIGWVWSLVGGS